MVILYNDKFIVTPDEAWYSNIKCQLTFIIQGRTVYLKNKRKIQTKDEIKEVFTLDEQNNMYIPSGLYPFFESYFYQSQVIDKRRKNDKYDMTEILSHIKDYKNILDGITLRDAQILACWKALKNKRGILQATTGFGKSEVLITISKLLSIANNGIYPTVLVLEPTIRLMEDTKKRFEKYNVNATIYNDNRGIIPNTVNIAHPSSLGNDLDKNQDLLKDVEVLFADETHHLKSDSWRKPTLNMKNCTYFIGLSASAIDQNHVGAQNISTYSYDELLTIGAAGQLLVNITTGDQVEIGSLATPVLCVIQNSHKDIELKREDDWQEVTKKHLQSPARINEICKTAISFSNFNRKVLILSSTITFARLICDQLDGLGMESICAFGGNKFEKAHKEKIKSMDEFENGNVNILIGSTVLTEGVDIKNLDVLILAVGGKSERIQTQGVGRVLRKTKNGKYAYIVDFEDNDSRVLNNQFRKRLSRYKNIMEIPQERIFHIDKNDILSGITNALEKMDDISVKNS